MSIGDVSNKEDEGQVTIKITISLMDEKNVPFIVGALRVIAGTFFRVPQVLFITIVTWNPNPIKTPDNGIEDFVDRSKVCSDVDFEDVLISAIIVLEETFSKIKEAKENEVF